MHFITELGAISRPLSFYLYQWRCFQGEHLDLRRPSMKWNAVSSLLCLLSRKVWGYFYGMHSKERLSQRTTIWSEKFSEQERLNLDVEYRITQNSIGLGHHHHFYRRYYYNMWECRQSTFLFAAEILKPYKNAKCSALNSPSGIRNLCKMVIDFCS